jgi:hypothetical protein
MQSKVLPHRLNFENKGIMMRPSIKAVITMFVLSATLIIISSCAPILSKADNTNNQSNAGGNVQYQIGASSMYVYPEGTSTLTYNALTLNGQNLVYKWVSTDGTITGNGPSATWKAPNQYGIFHVMLTVQDGNGGSETATIDLTVIPAPQPTDCPYCRQ